MSKPRVFVGSSVEGLQIAYAVQQNLSHNAEITVWSQGVFELSMTTIESLMSIIERSDFAIFIFSPDDIIKIRKEENLTVRDNVIFELGLFIGKIGRERTFIILPDKSDFHIPTDLLGIITGKFETNRSDGSYNAATGPVSNQIMTQITKLGKLHLSETSKEGDSHIEVKKPEGKELIWGDYYLEKNYQKSLELIEDEIRNSTDEEKRKQLFFWKYYVKYKINDNTTKKEILQEIENEPDNVDLYKAFSRILIYNNENELAKKIIEDGLLKFPNEESLLIRNAEYFETIGKNTDAIEILLGTNYQNNQDIISNVISLYEKEDIDNQIQFEFILNRYMDNPSFVNVGYKLARICQELGKDKIALSMFDKLLKNDDKNITYLGSLGNCCVTLELNNKALHFYNNANQLANSKEGWILANIGNVLTNIGYFEEAKKYLNSSLEVQSESDYTYNRISSTIKLQEEENKLYQKILQDGNREMNDEFEALKKKNSTDSAKTNIGFNETPDVADL